MKMASIVVAGLGVLALVLSVVDLLAQTAVLQVEKGGFIRGATALFLLALVIMVFDRNYCRKSEAAPATKP